MPANRTQSVVQRTDLPAGRAIRSLALIVALFGARAAVAQSTTVEGAEPVAMSGRAALSRDQLTALANGADGDDAARIQERLRDGDFNIGDRIVLAMKRDSALTTDTLVVRAERKIQLDGMPAISLQGVLRSELDGRLNQEIGRYIRSPDVHTGTLFRLAVLGEIGRPNFYYVAADMLVSDVVVMAGGPTSNSDLNKSTIKRSDKQIVSKDRMKQAIRDGQTLDQLSLRAGDELTIGKKRNLDWRTIATTAGVILSLTLTLVRLRGN